MRVARKCQECRKLKSRLDFPKDNSHEGFGPWCNDCLFTKPELSKLYNNQISKTMPTLKEKRDAEAAKAAAVKTTAPVKKETPKAEVADAPKIATKPLPKTGDKTAKGDTVVAEKKESAGRGRKAQPEKPIELIDKEGKITEYQTVGEVALELGCTNAYVIDGLKGWTKSVKGNQIRYKGEEVFVREKKPKTDAEKQFAAGDPKVKKSGKKEVAPVVVDIPVPGDLDYDPELHAPQPEAEEAEELDESVFEEEVETEE